MAYRHDHEDKADNNDRDDPARRRSGRQGKEIARRDVRSDPQSRPGRIQYQPSVERHAAHARGRRDKHPQIRGEVTEQQQRRLAADPFADRGDAPA